MTKILSLESSTDQCSVALYHSGEMISEHSNTPRAHAQEMLPMVERVLSSSELTLEQIDAIAFDRGPGSFTGLRICLSLAQGLSFGAQKKLIGVTSLEAMAAARFAETLQEQVISVLDARMGELYWAAYKKHSEEGFQTLIEPKLSKVDDAKQEISELINRNGASTHLVGPGCALLADLNGLNNCSVTEEERPSAEWVAQIAFNKWKLGQLQEPEHAELLYLRNSVSWNKRTKIRNK